jgi:hypothetical protein
MKLLIGRFFGLLAVVLLALQPVTVEAQHGNVARLTVHRIANFGNGIAVILYVDGTQVMTLSRGREYDGVLAPGRHLLTATVAPNVMMSRTFQRVLEARAGQTYSFTAKWQGTDVVLVPNS